MEMISIPGVNHVLVIPVNTIIRVEAQSNYCKIFLTDGQQLFYAKVLCWFEQRLPQNDFVRVNRGQLINKSFVSKIWGASHKEIELLNGDCIQISRRRQSTTRKAIAV